MNFLDYLLIISTFVKYYNRILKNILYLFSILKFYSEPNKNLKNLFFDQIKLYLLQNT
jgi:hypothetical protein